MRLFRDPLGVRATKWRLLRLPANPAPMLAVVDRLNQRRRTGELGRLTETRIEQSFNERLFSELFGYSTLLSHSHSPYHLEPKTQQAGRRIDDFSLGFFADHLRQPIVSCELKNPGTNLDMPQVAGASRGRSPVEQAFAAVDPSSTVEWIVVSNFDEIRLYSVQDSSAYERVFLSSISSRTLLEDALLLFSRSTLLGAESGDGALRRLLPGEPAMMLPQLPNHVRLLQQVRPVEPPQQEIPYYVLADTLEEALGPAFSAPRIEGESLVFEASSNLSGPEVVWHATKDGVIQAAAYAEKVDAGSGSLGAHFRGEMLLNCVFVFLKCAGIVLQKLEPAPVDVSWSLYDLEGATCHVPPTWFRANLPAELNLQAPTTESVAYLRGAKSLSAGASDEKLRGFAMRAVRELLFPLVGRHPGDPKVVRAIPKF